MPFGAFYHRDKWNELLPALQMNHIPIKIFALKCLMALSSCKLSLILRFDFENNHLVLGSGDVN